MSCIGRCDIAPAVDRQRAPGRRWPRRTPSIAAARTASAPPGRGRRRRRRAVAERSVRRRRRSSTGSLRDVLAGDLAAPARSIATLTDTGLRGMGGAGFPTGREVGAGRGAGRHAEVRDLQRRRVRAGHVQGPADPGRPAAPGARGHAARDARDRRRGRLGVHPARVRPGGGGGPPGDRPLRARLIGAGLGGGRARHRPAPVGRGVHLAGRLHPRRGVGPDRVHGGPPRGAAEQAAVPRRVRPARPAHADELGRDVRPRPGHRPAGRRLVEGAGRGRERRAEVLRGLRPRRAARGLLRADGHDRPAAARPGRRGRPAAGGSAPSSRAGPRRTSSGPHRSTCRWTSARCGRPGRCSARARSS